MESSVQLRPITEANWGACAALDVRAHQRAWLPSNLHSIAAAQFYPDNACRAVHAGDQLVGFGLYGIEHPTGRVKVFRLMIAAEHQRRGHGFAAMRLMLREMADRWPGADVFVSFQADNSAARHLYERLGFHEVERSGDKVTARRLTQGLSDLNGDW